MSSSARVACSPRLGAHTRWNNILVSRSDRFRAACTERLPHVQCWASHRANENDESIKQKIFDGVEQRIRRVIDISDDTALETKELSNGFCNSVVLVSTKEEKLVVKLYSELSLLRTEPHQRGVIDESASLAELGPAVRSNTGEGIAHVFLPGRILEEKDMHTIQGVGIAAAKLVAAFHSLPVPPEFNTNEPLLWKWLDRMLEAIERSDNADVLPDEANLQALRHEVRRVSAAVQGRVGTTIVLAHGDLKPSNVLLIGEDPVDLQLIDLELSGPNYRGFDLMKLFRTSPDNFSESHFRNFLAHVLGNLLHLFELLLGRFLLLSSTLLGRGRIRLRRRLRRRLLGRRLRLRRRLRLGRRRLRLCLCLLGRLHLGGRRLLRRPSLLLARRRRILRLRLSSRRLALRGRGAETAASAAADAFSTDCPWCQRATRLDLPLARQKAAQCEPLGLIRECEMAVPMI